MNIDSKSRQTEKAHHDEHEEAQEYQYAHPLRVGETVVGTLVHHISVSPLPVLNACWSRPDV